jgi:hypothetical protein
MILLRWLVFPVLLLGAAVLAAWWLRRGARVPLMMLAVAAGFSLLSLLAEILVIAAIRAAGVRNGLPWAAVGVPATVAVCAETFRYLSFRAGPVMRANRTSVGALMAGLGYGGMIVICALVVLVIRLLHSSWAHARPFFALGFSFGFAFSYACVIGAELGLATLVVLAYRRSRLYLPLAIIAHFAVTCTLALAAYVRAVLWLLLLGPFWAAAGIALVVLVHRSGWLAAPPQGEPAAVESGDESGALIERTRP